MSRVCCRTTSNCRRGSAAADVRTRDGRIGPPPARLVVSAKAPPPGDTLSTTHDNQQYMPLCPSLACAFARSAYTLASVTARRPADTAASGCRAFGVGDTVSHIDHCAVQEVFWATVCDRAQNKCMYTPAASRAVGVAHAGICTVAFGTQGSDRVHNMLSIQVYGCCGSCTVFRKVNDELRSSGDIQAAWRQDCPTADRLSCNTHTGMENALAPVKTKQAEQTATASHVTAAPHVPCLRIGRRQR